MIGDHGRLMWAYSATASKLDGRTIEVRIGTAVLLADGSIEVKLDALPASGKLILRPKE